VKSTPYLTSQKGEDCGERHLLSPAKKPARNDKKKEEESSTGGISSGRSQRPEGLAQESKETGEKRGGGRTGNGREDAAAN